jgi:hypothetical protein
MKLLKVIVLLLLLLPTLVIAQKKTKKPSLPAVFDHAHYVYVEAIDGDEFKRGLYVPDRLAIADIKDAIRNWGRYTLTFQREQADLVFVVRKGRLASGRVSDDDNGEPEPLGEPQRGQQGAQIPGQQRSRGPVLGTGSAVGREDDLLKVCQFRPDGKLGSPIWIRTFANGLDAPQLILFAQLKDAVERAYPNAPAKP